ncbi:hypothetical protein N7454_007271 [Penicillium verhagenii]|nr:hypothetical protein N7454_007271 [Penicillium verhagenii]
MALEEKRALVSSGPHQTGGWKMKNIHLRPLKESELLVEMVASGVCQTDLHFGGMESGSGVHYPRILGHEGAGYVREVGPFVKAAKKGDSVILSFRSCQSCEQCTNQHPAHCRQAQILNFEVGPEHLVGRESSADQQEPNIYGKFFGQSSFASWSIVSEESVVNVSKLVDQKKDLAMLSPLGCGVQTGAGAIMNIADAGPSDRILVLGLGGVGLSAVMAARIRGCKTIIAIDRHESRLILARELGATDCVNTLAMNSPEMVDAVREITNDLGSTVTLDTTGVPALIRQGLNMTGLRGKVIQVGTAPETAILDIPIHEFMTSGRQFIGVIEGDAVPQTFIPQMIQWFREGKLPLQKIVTFYQADQFQTAIRDMQSGLTIKPVLLW